LYGLSLLLEFAALLVLRIREPQLARPFRVPGGKTIALLLGLGPALLIGWAIYDQSGKWGPEESEPIDISWLLTLLRPFLGKWVPEEDQKIRIAPAHALLLAACLAALGPVIYSVYRAWQRRAERAKLQ
jgi:amino acid transporter